MKKTTTKHLLAVLLATALLTLAACASDTPSPSVAYSDRLAALETEVKALKLEAAAREGAFREELAQIRKNLDGIRALLEVEKGRADVLEAPGTGPKTEEEKLDREIDKKAKSFVSENLDRLLEITKKLLDKMERELDEHMKQTQPAPKGDEI